MAKSASLVAREALRLAVRAAADPGAGARFRKRALRGTKVDKSKAPATVRGRYIRKKAERQKKQIPHLRSPKTGDRDSG